MDTRGSIIDASVRIFPSKKLQDFINNLQIKDDTPQAFKKFKNVDEYNDASDKDSAKANDNKSYMELKDFTLLKSLLKDVEIETDDKSTLKLEDCEKEKKKYFTKEENSDKYLLISDLEWLSSHLEHLRNGGECIYLHELLEGSDILLPENEIIKRNPILEARCVRLRKDQSNRDYRLMTKNVDNVRVRQPEETIAYQLKGMNRQLIAIGQFVLSVGAGFLFGFLGVELMIGRLDFGFRLLLGVMCALIIALAEIYFLAKKLNEDLSIGETIQLGGPTVYPDKGDKLHKD